MMQVVTIELTGEQVAVLKVRAEAQGLTEGWLRKMAEQHVPSGSLAHLQRTDPQEWLRLFDVTARCGLLAYGSN